MMSEIAKQPWFLDLEDRWHRTAQRTMAIRAIAQQVADELGVRLVETPAAYWFSWQFASSDVLGFLVTLPQRILSDGEVAQYFRDGIRKAV